MRILIAIMAAAPLPASASPHPDSYCVKIGQYTESTAKLRELGAVEADLAARRAQSMRAKPGETPAEVKKDAKNLELMNNVAAYVYTVKLPTGEARLVGYKKCMAGDFD